MTEHRPEEPRPEPRPEPRRRIDAKSLRGLAHPLRMRILDELRERGPATSARLSDRLGESTGTISWHLRHLAEHGFITEEPDRGTRRERWWRAAGAANVLSTTDFDRDPGSREALSVYLGELLRTQFQRVADSMAAEWPEEWRGVGTTTAWTNLRLTPAQLTALNAELTAVVERHTPDPDVEPDPAARPVVVQIQALPRKDPDRT
ncbi:helix-turn-helix domain-containing protein [Kitasatospora paracochleata]|uniref:DNA-binding transcriptional ArsR family regulator n=1 Tax=Kitasatospora paracochleata TaxID=58354 RepID=A0ABT1IZC6_9ACTN|nr:helix-turn-helix domain-containing protein [Kitasatospora paracochleata]MCP2310488.1 DNA-binding transcriptional ArsR family regulator [Kitasatospora paracochleata]